MSIVLVGSTSGSVTLQEPAIAGTTVLDLPATSGNVVVDTATQTLTNKSIVASQLTGTIAAARLPTGSVLQVISSTDSTERNTTSTSFGTASNTLSVTITPTSATSKIFIICNTGVFKATAGSGYLTIYRGATNLGGSGGMAQFQQAIYSSSCISFLDSPATTSATTYQLYFKSNDSNPAYIGANNGGGTGSLTVFEIAA
jgi:hypothetical protein